MPVTSLTSKRHSDYESKSLYPRRHTTGDTSALSAYRLAKVRRPVPRLATARYQARKKPCVLCGSLEARMALAKRCRFVPKIHRINLNVTFLTSAEPLFWWLRFFVLPLHRISKKPKVLCPFVLFLKQPMKERLNIQLITAALLALGGLILLFCGMYIEPKGEIEETVLVAFGEVMTFSGSLMGIDYKYRSKYENHNPDTKTGGGQSSTGHPLLRA